MADGKKDDKHGANGVSNGVAPHPHDEHDDDVADGEDVAGGEDGTIGAERMVLPAPPDAIAELCAAAIRFVASKYKVALDGTPDTLSLVDQYVRDARDAMKERPESIDLVAPALGAYFGEVLRQEFGAEWFAEGTPEAYRLYFSNVYLSFNPVGMLREALTESEQEGWHAHLELDPGEREIIEQRLAVMPEVDEEEYFLPTTRFEVIAVVVQTLRALAEQSGLGDVHFTREDYD